MLGKLFQKIRGVVDEPDPFDPSRFGDPVAKQTNWIQQREAGQTFEPASWSWSLPTGLSFVHHWQQRFSLAVFSLVGWGLRLAFPFSILPRAHSRSTLIRSCHYSPESRLPSSGAFCCTLALRPLFLTKPGDSSGRGERREMACSTVTQ